MNLRWFVNCEMHLWFCWSRASHIGFNGRLLHCCSETRNSGPLDGQALRALFTVSGLNQIWILPSSVGFPPRFPDQKIEGQLLPVIRKLSESQQEAGSWLEAFRALSTLGLQGHLDSGFMLLGLAVQCPCSQAARRGNKSVPQVFNSFSYMSSCNFSNMFGMSEWSFFGLMQTLFG